MQVKGKLVRTQHIGLKEYYYINQDTKRLRLYYLLPPLDYWSSWMCLDCGATGEWRESYRSSLRVRVRAHLNCRCKAR